MSSAAPTVKPIKLKGFSCKQSSYNDVVPKLPMRSVLCGPSSSGKAVLSSNMILDMYRSCYSRVHIWSPSINVDSTWLPVKEYIRDHIKPNDREHIFR